MVLYSHILRFLTVIILFLYALSTWGGNDVYFSKIGIENGLSQLSVMQIYQDELGNMWFGTREGVNIYNGSGITVMQSKSNSINSLSGSRIKNICGDGKGAVFIHTQNGVDRYDLHLQTVHTIENRQIDAMTYGADRLLFAKQNQLFVYQEEENPLLMEISDKKAVISEIFVASDERIYLGTIESGLYVSDIQGCIMHLMPYCGQVSHIYEDGRRNVWVATWENGLYRIETSGTVTNYRETIGGLSSNFVRTVCEDDNGLIWIGTKNGLDRLDVQAGRFSHYDSEEQNLRKLSNESVWALYKDFQGTIWVGTYFGGVNYFNPSIGFYTFHDLQNGVLRNKPFPVISKIIEDKKHEFFLCTEGAGLLHYNPDTKNYKEYYPQLQHKNIKTAYYEPKNNRLWLGLHLGGLSLLDTQTGRFTNYPEIKSGLRESNIVRAIVPYGDSLLVATHNGLYLFDKEEGKFSIFSEKLHESVTYFIDLQLDGEDNLWIASRGVFKYNPKTGICHSYMRRQDDTASLGSNNISKIFIDNRQRVWIATSGGGINLYLPQTDSFRRFNTENSGLRNDYISNVVQLPSGKLLLTTTQGFSTLDPQTEEIDNYSPDNGFPLNSLYNGGVTVADNNDLYIAGMNGMVSFREDELDKKITPFRLHFSALWTNNVAVTPGDSTGILSAALPFTEAIRLNHKQSMIVDIEFTSDNFIVSNYPLYRYRLLGFSEQWVYVRPGVNRLNFMNLDAGRYHLELQALSSSTQTVLAQTLLALRVAPPIYKTWYAYLFYVLLLLFVVWRYARFVESRTQLEASIAYQKREKKHLESVNQSKLRFFTNISHEFRTPLTLISSQVEMMMQAGKIAPSIHNHLLGVKRNTELMQNLINELLEFRKAENGKMVIHVEPLDIVSFIHEIYLSFKEYAGFMQIDFSFHADEDVEPLWFDPSQMKKVFYNIISNAFKYTRKNGNVKIEIRSRNDIVSVSVKDNGMGIPEEEIGRIFTHFYQVESGADADRHVSPGTGIGLALTKHILNAHRAEIDVSSMLGEGSLFDVMIKKGEAHFTDEQKKASDSLNNLTVNNLQPYGRVPAEIAGDEQPDTATPQNRMLIVEDNPELLHVLKTAFSSIYTVYTATNGEEGLEKTIAQQPSIVLTDLMMPLLSGSEMCLKIKSNFITSHIPVVLLTAQTSAEANVESLKLGADDYITKPFDMNILVAKCNNLVNGRRLLQEKFSKSADFSPATVTSVGIDCDFLEKAYAVIEENIDNESFDVTLFATLMALGRTKLFNKIKGITGQTPNEFILTVKMKKATYLLRNHPGLNITDIAFKLGFSSPKYFSKCFKEQFGLSPSDYREKKMDKPDF